MTKIKRPSTEGIFLIVTIIIGVIAVLPQVFYQPFFLQGDHGRDLYIFQQTAHGAVPYRDYDTANGPLMPYYYGAALSYFGETIQSVLFGYALMIFLAGFLIFLIARKGLPPGMAFLCALWYWAWRGQEFFYTFNHIGAIVAALATVHSTITNIEWQRRRYFLFGLCSSLLCMLIRPDIGIASLAGLLISSLIFRKKDYLPQRSFFVIMLSILGGVCVIINLFVPEMFLPYWNAIHPGLIAHNIMVLGQLWFVLFTQNCFTAGLTLLITILCLLGAVHLWETRSSEESKKILRSLTCLAIFFLLFLMEFLVGNRFFRWVWVFPVSVLMIFHFLYCGLLKIHTVLRSLIYVLLMITCAVLLLLPIAEIAVSKNQQSVLNVGASKVMMAPDQKPWITTVKQTCVIIDQTTDPDEEILALPYDAIYCFLTKRRLASNQPDLFGTPADRLIPQIEQKKVRLIVISNRAFRPNEPNRFGIFGKTYGRDLWRYIQTHYRLIAQIGPWEKTATPIFNHATRIYVRTAPFAHSSGLTVKKH